MTLGAMGSAPCLGHGIQQRPTPWIRVIREIGGGKNLDVPG